MPTKQTTVKEVVSKAEGKPADVQLEARPDVVEVTERSGRDTAETAPVPKKAVGAAGFVAFADFELLGKQYKAGDKFVMPEGWEHETAFDTFRSSESKSGRDLGAAFIVLGEIINRKTGERAIRREVLPVKAA